jgi:hypothetical protein
LYYKVRFFICFAQYSSNPIALGKWDVPIAGMFFQPRCGGQKLCIDFVSANVYNVDGMKMSRGPAPRQNTIDITKEGE